MTSKHPVEVWTLNEGRRVQGKEDQQCYLHEVEDANETPYDQKVHCICAACADKLRSMGERGVQFVYGKWGYCSVDASKEEWRNEPPFSNLE